MLFALLETGLDPVFVYGVWFVGVAILAGAAIIAWAIRSRQP
jgi:hypothetical protein